METQLTQETLLGVMLYVIMIKISVWCKPQEKGQFASDCYLLSVHLWALSPSLVGPVGSLILLGDFSSDSTPASVLHGASPSAPAKSTGVSLPCRYALRKLQNKTNDG